VLAGIAASLQEIFPEANLLVDKFWVIFCFLAGITYIAYVTADLGIKRDPEVGVMAIMASIAVKMIFSMAFVLIYSQNRPQLGGIFLTNFFSLYLLFTCFEIYWLLRNLRHQNK
jgi:heme/copper-type cytochrome/quinol oxidase subunit 4